MSATRHRDYTDEELQQLFTVPLLRDIVDILTFATGADLPDSEALRVRAAGTPDEVLAVVDTVKLLRANGSRKGGTVYNDSTATLYVLLGPRATANEWTVKLLQDDYYELPAGYRGEVSGFFSAAGGGQARVTEYGW